MKEGMNEKERMNSDECRNDRKETIVKEDMKWWMNEKEGNWCKEWRKEWMRRKEWLGRNEWEGRNDKKEGKMINDWKERN